MLILPDGTHIYNNSKEAEEYYKFFRSLESINLAGRYYRPSKSILDLFEKDFVIQDLKSFFISELKENDEDYFIYREPSASIGLCHKSINDILSTYTDTKIKRIEIFEQEFTFYYKDDFVIMQYLKDDGGGYEFCIAFKFFEQKEFNIWIDTLEKEIKKLKC